MAQSKDYYSSLSEKIRNGILQPKESQLIDLKEVDPVSSLSIKTKTGQYPRGILSLEILNQNKTSFTELIDQDFIDVSSEGAIISESGRYQLDNSLIILNPITTFRAPLTTQQAYIRIKDNRSNTNSFLESLNCTINFRIPIQFEGCDIGEIYNSKFQSCEICTPGTFSFVDPKKSQDTKCELCQENMLCISRNVSVPGPNFWKASQIGANLIECPFASDCIGGSPNSRDNFVSQTGHCAFPSIGNLCGQCENGYTREHPQKACVNCQDGPAKAKFALLLILQTIFICVVTLAKVQARINILSENQSQQKNSSTRNGDRLDYLSQLIKITFNYFETIRILELFSLQDLSAFSTFVAIFTSIIPSQDQSFSIDCIIELHSNHKDTQYIAKYIAILLKPLVLFFGIILVSALILLIRKFILKIKSMIQQKWNKRQQQQRGSSQKKQIGLPTLKILKQYIYSLFIVILYFTLPHIINSSLEILTCRTIGTNDEYLTSNPDIKCWEGTHRSTSTVAIIILIFVGVILPLITFIILCYHYRQNSKTSNQFNTKSSNKRDLNYSPNLISILNNVLVHGSINEKYYYWEILNFFRKTLLMVALYAVAKINSIETFMVTLFIMIMFGTIHSYASPYKFKSLNKFEMISFISIYLLLMGSNIYENTPSNSGKPMGKTITILFVTIATILTLYFAYELIICIFFKSKFKKQNRNQLQEKISIPELPINTSPSKLLDAQGFGEGKPAVETPSNAKLLAFGPNKGNTEEEGNNIDFGRQDTLENEHLKNYSQSSPRKEIYAQSENQVESSDDSSDKNSKQGKIGVGDKQQQQQNNFAQLHTENNLIDEEEEEEEGEFESDEEGTDGEDEEEEEEENDDDGDNEEESIEKSRQNNNLEGDNNNNINASREKVEINQQQDSYHEDQNQSKKEETVLELSLVLSEKDE